MNNQEFDNLIPEISKLLSNKYLEILHNCSMLNRTIDASPLLNLTVSCFLSSLINILDKIKEHTIGEVKLMENIELTKESIIKALESLPFVRNIEIMKS